MIEASEPPAGAAASPLLEGLNPQQQQAVLATGGAVLIQAGAGSGKTRVITHRIAHLIRERGVLPEQVLAVTFTNKAAAEMRARVASLLGEESTSLWIMTFHSFCVRLLRRHADALGRRRDFVIYDADDQLAAVRTALRALGLPEKLHPPRRVLSRLSARKNRALPQGPAAVAAECTRNGDNEEEMDAPDLDPDGPEPSLSERLLDRVADRYGELLREANALDFDDLLVEAVALLNQEAAVRERWQRRFRYVLVDEYQDTNRVQYQLVRLLVGADGNLTVVGDEDQSIYSWRGADIRNILDFERDFSPARVLRLEHNYRSVQPILDAAAGLVAHNRSRLGKRLLAVSGDGEPVRVHRAADEYHEAAWTVAHIEELLGTGRVAVLYRVNAQSRLLEEALLRRNLSYCVVGGVGFYARKEIKDLLAYLRVVRNPRDDVALRRVLNVPPRGIGGRTLAELERLAAARQDHLWGALVRAVDEALLPARACQPLLRFRDLMLGLQRDVDGSSLRQLLGWVLERSGYAAALAHDNSVESQERLANLAELLQAADDFSLREPEGGLIGFLDSVSLLSDADEIRDDVPVVLMTLHSAKGLEFDAVFLVGMEEGLAPHARSLQSARALEEERRLCYVGMTRAKRRLFMSWAVSRQVFGQRRLSEPSRFLSEIPRRHVQLSGLDAGRPGVSVETPTSLLPALSGPDELRPGRRVRHPLFGVGTVLRNEGRGDGLKVTVSFPGLGPKCLMARYAGLVPA